MEKHITLVLQMATAMRERSMMAVTAATYNCRPQFQKPHELFDANVLQFTNAQVHSVPHFRCFSNTLQLWHVNTLTKSEPKLESSWICPLCTPRNMFSHETIIVCNVYCVNKILCDTLSLDGGSLFLEVISSFCSFRSWMKMFLYRPCAQSHGYRVFLTFKFHLF